MDDHEQRCAELYRIGNLPADVPDGLLVVGSTTCTLCKQTMRNNDYATEAAGVPVIWININEPDGINKFYTTPGIAWSDELGGATAAGHRLGGTPIYLWVEGGAVKRDAIGYGEQPEGGLAALVTKAQGK